MITRKSMEVFIITLVVSFGIAISFIQASAETLNYKFTTWQIKSEIAPAYDVPGHAVFLATRGALYSFDNGEVATVTVSLIGDMTAGKGPFTQYVNIKFPDKSVIVIKSQGYFGGDAADWKSEILRGTGRFEGIKGTQQAKGKYLPLEAGETGQRGYGEGSITYTLPSK